MMDYAYGITVIAVLMTAQISQAAYLSKAGFLEKMPENCIGLSYCLEKHPGYPQKNIDLLLTEKYKIELVSEHADPIFREGDLDSTENCEKNITYGSIYEILDENDNVRVVVQSAKFRQNLRIESCRYPGRLLHGTDQFTAEELQVHHISCVEKKMDYNFLVLSQDGNNLETVKSKHGIPVCCSCRVVNKN